MRLRSIAVIASTMSLVLVFGVFIMVTQSTKINKSFRMSGTLQCRFVKHWGNWAYLYGHDTFVINDLYSEQPWIKFTDGSHYEYTIRSQNTHFITLEDLADGIFSLDKSDGTFVATNLTVGGSLGTQVCAGMGYCG